METWWRHDGDMMERGCFINKSGLPNNQDGLAAQIRWHSVDRSGHLWFQVSGWVRSILLTLILLGYNYLMLEVDLMFFEVKTRYLMFEVDLMVLEVTTIEFSKLISLCVLFPQWPLTLRHQVRRASFIHELLKENLQTYETAEDNSRNSIGPSMLIFEDSWIPLCVDIPRMNSLSFQAWFLTWFKSALCWLVLECSYVLCLSEDLRRYLMW